MSRTTPAVHAGVDLGGTKIQSVIVEPSGEVVAESFLLTPRDRGSDGVVSTIIDGVLSALAKADLTPSSLAGVGIGAPGRIDAAGGTVTAAGNLVDWSGSVPVVSPVSEALGCPVVLRGDVQSGVIAEALLGAGRGYTSLLGVFCGTGVGGGLILDSRVWRSRGAAGEIGHMTAHNGGRPCPCGLRGCLEAYAGRAPMETEARERAGRGEATILFDLMREMGRTSLTGEVWASALTRQDPLAAALIDDNVAAMGIVIASAVNLLDVEAVIIGGGLAHALGDAYLHRVTRAMSDHLLYPDHPLDILPTQLPELGGALGAAIASMGGEP